MSLNVQSDTTAVVPAVTSEPSDMFAGTFTYFEQLRDWELAETLLAGTHAMRIAGRRYLPQEPAEDARDYEVRLARSVLLNYYARTINTATNKVFSKDMQLVGVPTSMEPWLDDIDMQGRSIHQFSREAFRSGVNLGLSFILVDSPKSPDLGRIRTKEDDDQLGIRPYLNLIKATQVIGFRSNLIKGREQLTQVRIREDRMVPLGDYGEVYQQRVRILEIGKWSLWGRNIGSGEGNNVALIDSGTYDLQYIPIVPFYTNRIGYLRARPAMLDLAHVQLRHYASYSDQANILKIARLPILHIADVDDPDAADNKSTGGDLVLGANHAVRTGLEAKLQFVEHTGKAIDAGRTDLMDLRDAMEDLGSNLFMRRNSADKTATESSGDQSEANSALQAFAINFEDAMETALGMMAELAGVEKTEDIGVITNKEYGINLSAGDMSLIMQMRNNGNITTLTQLMEAKRRGLFKEDFNPAEEIIAARAEAPLTAVAAVTAGAGTYRVEQPGE